MGRTVRRVPLDFKWPMNKVWGGFVDPYYALHRAECSDCDGAGYNPETKKIADDWYDFAKTGRRWDNRLTQHEVDALIEGGRLMDFTHKWDPEQRKNKKIDPPPKVTAEQVNEWSNERGLGHDAINRCICVRARAEKLGVYGHCLTCSGTGEVWTSAENRRLSEAWEPTDPPAGDGYQMWENTSEGSPISPVFETPEELATWLASTGASVFGADTATYEQWLVAAKRGS